VTADLSLQPRSIYSPQLRATTVGILIVITLAAFESMGVAAALPTAARALHGLAAYGWAFSAFLASTVVAMVWSGQLSDQHGARLPLVGGLIGFGCGLAISGTATTMAQFVAGRAVQGLGSGLLITAVYVVIGTTYAEHLRSKVFAALASAWVVPSMVGPVIAGSLAQHLSWRWVFLGLIPFVALGSALLAPVLTSLPRPERSVAPVGRRVPQAVAVAVAVVALEQAGQHPSGWSIALAAGGLLALAWGLHSLLPAGTWLARRGVAAAIAVRGLMAGALFGVEALLPLSLSVQHHYGATVAALPLTVCGITWAAGSWYQGRDPGVDGRRLVRIGFALVLATALLAALAVQPAVSGLVMFLAWGLGGAGAGLAMSSASVLMLACTTDADRGADSSSLQLADAVSSAVTTGLAGVLVAAAARGALGYTSAFTVLDLSMAALAALGLAVAGRARPAAN
jgi:MFS family permease